MALPTIRRMQGRLAWAAALALIATGCAATKPPVVSPQHLGASADSADRDQIPALVSRAIALAPPQPAPKAETYTVVVNDVPVKELLFALARDAKINVDVHPSIQGTVTLNAVNQTLLQILNRISEQVPLIYELQGGNLTLSPDSPILRSYRVDYVNMSRTSSSSVSVATRMATAGGTVADSGASDMGNNSSTSVTSTNTSDFWTALIANIQAILGQQSTTTPATEGSMPLGAGDVIANPMSGIVTVRATQRQHRQIQQFIDQVLANAQRQVLIEATIVEVELGDRYQAGIDWSYVQTHGGKTISAASAMTGNNLALPPTFLLGYNRDSSDKDITSTVRLLETFGDTKVLSSPKLLAMNNQTALLKVVDEKVYFTVEYQRTEGTDNAAPTENWTSELHTVPVGVVMSVTPQVNDNGNITLNIRPTISRITGYVVDPTPRLQDATFDNLIPEIQIREMETLLQVRTGQTVVLGGLMQDSKSKDKSGVPLLSDLPWVGNLFSYRDENFTKTELVIFLRPVMGDEPGMREALSLHSENLPAARSATAQLSGQR